MPVFDNIPIFQAQMSYLIYCVRSTEFWVVKSRVSGDFDPERKEATLDICRKLIDLLHTVCFEVGKPVPKGNYFLILHS